MPRLPTLALVLLFGCKGSAEVTPPATQVVTPVATPVPTPTPPPTPLPAGNTLLTTVPVADWQWICERVSIAQDAVSLTCPDFNLNLPARTVEEDVQICVDYFEQAQTWTGCTATFDDFLVMTNFIPTCNPPDEIVRIMECKDPPPPTPPTPPPTPIVCESLALAQPGDGATGVFTDTDLHWTFTNVDTSLVVEVVDGTGALVTGSGSWAANVFSWEPDQPLESSTFYESSLTWCNGVSFSSTGFTTNAVGPVVPPADLPARVYGIDLQSPSIVFVQPPGVGGLLQSQLSGDLILSVIEASATELDLRMAIAEPSTFAQDLCVESVELPTSDFTTNPYFAAGPATLTVDMGAAAAELQEATLEGASSPSGDALYLSMSAQIDTRPLVDLLSPGGAPDAVCVLVAQFGINCIPCAAGGDFCLPLEIENIEAQEVIGGSLVERTLADIQADANCVP